MPYFGRPPFPVALGASGAGFAMLHEQTQRLGDLAAGDIVSEQIANFRSGHTVRVLSKRLKDFVGDVIAKGVAEDVTRRRLAVIPNGCGSGEVRRVDHVALIKQCIEGGETHGLRWRARSDGTREPRASGRQGFVLVLPDGSRRFSETDAPIGRAGPNAFQHPMGPMR